MQTLAYSLILEQLLSHGLLVGTVEELLEKDVGALFSEF